MELFFTTYYQANINNSYLLKYIVDNLIHIYQNTRDHKNITQKMESYNNILLKYLSIKMIEPKSIMSLFFCGNLHIIDKYYDMKNEPTDTSYYHLLCSLIFSSDVNLSLTKKIILGGVHLKTTTLDELFKLFTSTEFKNLYSYSNCKINLVNSIEFLLDNKCIFTKQYFLDYLKYYQTMVLTKYYIKYEKSIIS